MSDDGKNRVEIDSISRSPTPPISPTFEDQEGPLTPVSPFNKESSRFFKPDQSLEEISTEISKTTEEELNKQHISVDEVIIEFKPVITNRKG